MLQSASLERASSNALTCRCPRTAHAADRCVFPSDVGRSHPRDSAASRTPSHGRPPILGRVGRCAGARLQYVQMFKTPQVVLFSSDLPRAARFYEALGFEEVFKTPSEGTPIHIDLVLDGTASAWRARRRRATTMGWTRSSMASVRY